MLAHAVARPQLRFSTRGIILSECACMKPGWPLIIFCLRCLLLLLVVAAPLCGTRLESFILAGAGIAAVSIDMGTEWIKVGIVKVGKSKYNGPQPPPHVC